MSDETNVVELEPELKSIADKLDGLSLLQASKLVKHLEDKWGVSAAAPAAVAMAPAAGGGAGDEPEAKTSFDVILLGAGDKKIQVIKEVRAITGLGLKEAKELVDSTPKAVKQGVSQDEADSIKGQLEAAGASVKID